MPSNRAVLSDGQDEIVAAGGFEAAVPATERAQRPLIDSHGETSSRRGCIPDFYRHAVHRALRQQLGVDAVGKLGEGCHQSSEVGLGVAVGDADQVAGRQVAL